MSDISHLLEEAVGSHSVSQDQEVVRRLVERRRRNRRGLAAVVGLIVFAAGAWFAWGGLRPGRPFAPSSVETGTYVLSDFHVRPSTDPRSSEIVDGEAQVSFRIDWSSDAFPGDHRCTIRIYDSEGNAIGTLETQVTALSQGNHGEADVAVHGEIAGATADGSCASHRLDTPVAYSISDVRVEVIPWNDTIRGESGRALEVHYRATSPAGLGDDDYPGTNACALAVFRADGSVLRTYEHTITVGAGSTIEARVARDLAEDVSGEGLSANVVCEPFTAEGRFPDATGGVGDPIDVPTADSIMRNGGPVGTELAKRLGLKLLPAFPANCDYYAEVREDGAGYCLHGIADGDRLDQLVIAEALRGHVMSDDEVAGAEETLRNAGSL